MRKLILIFLAIIMVASFSNMAVAQTSATTSATVTATIIAPISISKTGTDMSFGNVIKGAGTIVLAPAGTRSGTAALLPGTQAGTVTAAVFTVSGEGSSTYAITLPAADYTITNTTGTGNETMIVNSFTSNPSGTGTLSSGSQELRVGATLNVTAGQVSGVYTNSTGFNVTVAYN
jgi:hypothetical protein